MKVSLLIPSNKKEVERPLMPYEPHEFLVSNVKGITESRLDLVARSTGDILIMIDDDVTVTRDSVWLEALDLKPGEFMISKGRNHPVTWFLAIRRADYVKMGGFDPAFSYAVDWDLYLRAVKAGLKPIILGHDSIFHVDHPRRYTLMRHWDAGRLRARHPEIINLKWFIKPDPLVFTTQVVSLIYFSGLFFAARVKRFFESKIT